MVSPFSSSLLTHTCEPKRCTQPNKKTGGKETQGDVASIEHYGFSVKIMLVMGFPFWAAFGGSAIFF
jgi:hypothetical protein